MTKGEPNNYLDFVRKSIKELDIQINALDGGNWNRNIRGDYDKEMLYSGLLNIRKYFRSLLRRDYDCENVLIKSCIILFPGIFRKEGYAVLYCLHPPPFYQSSFLPFCLIALWFRKDTFFIHSSFFLLQGG
mgnify:CR=1 FL=1